MLQQNLKTQPVLKCRHRMTPVIFPSVGLVLSKSWKGCYLSNLRLPTFYAVMNAYQHINWTRKQFISVTVIAVPWTVLLLYNSL